MRPSIEHYVQMQIQTYHCFLSLPISPFFCSSLPYLYTICRSKWLQLLRNNWCMRFSLFTIRFPFPFMCVVTNVNRHIAASACNVHYINIATCIHTTNKSMCTMQHTHTYTQREREIKMQTDVNFRLFEMPKMQFSLLLPVTLLFGHYFVDQAKVGERERAEKVTKFKLNLNCIHLCTLCAF